MLLLVCAFKYCAFTSLLISLAWDWLKGTCGFFKSHKGFQKEFFPKGVFSMLLCQGTLYQSTSSVVQVPFLVAQPCPPPTLRMMLSNALNHHDTHHAQAWTFPYSSPCLFCLFLFPRQNTKAATTFNWPVPIPLSPSSPYPFQDFS